MPAQIVPPYTWSRSEQRVKHSVFNAFLLSHDSSNQPHHSCSAIVDSSPGADQSSASSILCSMCFYNWHGTDESIRISVVAELTCVLTPVLGFVHASCLWLCFHPTSQRKNPGPGTVNHSEVSTCARPIRTPKLFLLSSDERHQTETQPSVSMKQGV